MTQLPPEAATRKNRLEATRFRIVRRVHQGRRLVQWALGPRRWAPRSHGSEPLPVVVPAISVPIARADDAAHPLLEAGKRHNVALAVQAIDGATFDAARPFSFWRVVGRLTEARGYRHGMALNDGCVVPTVGGGVCLVSNSLFQLAAGAGWDIVERHGHSVEAVPHSGDGLWGMDATLSWPDVDLRFAPPAGLARLHARVDGDHLRLWASTTVSAPDVRLSATADRQEGTIRENTILRWRDDRREVLTTNRKRLTHAAQRHRSCLTCGEQDDCHLVPSDVRRHLSGEAPLR